MRLSTSLRARLLPAVVAAGLLVTVAPLPSASAATVPAGFTVTAVTSTLTDATALAPLPDGRVLVAQQGGRLRVLENGVLLAAPMLSLTVDSTGERGLLGVTASPRFATDGLVFVHYTVRATATRAAHARIERWRVPAGADVADPASRRVLLDLPALGSVNHNGGAIHFDGAGKLLVAVGDNFVRERAQSLTNPFGKMLRIEPDTGAAAAGNPYLGNANAWARRIWALGLRNPFTFGVSRSGRVHVNDVGQDSWEEINRGAARANYGWPLTEGPTTAAGITGPVEAYGHGADGGCSIAGGDFYDPATATFPAAYVGDYLYGDFCGGWVRRYDVGTDTSTGFATDLGNVVDLLVAPGGRAYVLTRSTLWRIDHPGP